MYVYSRQLKNNIKIQFSDGTCKLESRYYATLLYVQGFTSQVGYKLKNTMVGKSMIWEKNLQNIRNKKLFAIVLVTFVIADLTHICLH